MQNAKRQMFETLHKKYILMRLDAKDWHPVFSI